MHGVAVPELVWCGRDLARFPVDGREFLGNRARTPQQLYVILRRQYGRWSVHPLLVEEYLEEREGLPRATQFNFYCFSVADEVECGTGSTASSSVCSGTTRSTALASIRSLSSAIASPPAPPVPGNYKPITEVRRCLKVHRSVGSHQDGRFVE